MAPRSSLVSTVIGTLLGIAAGAIIAVVVARRVAHRPTLSVRLEPTLVLYPGDFDVHGNLTFALGGRSVRNICALTLEVGCKGQKDIVVEDAAPPRAPSATPLPRLDFHDFRIIGIQTLNNDTSLFYIPLSRHSSDRGIYINVHRLRAGACAQFQIVGELENGRRRFAPEQCDIFPGAIPDTQFATSGTIAPSWLTS